MSFRLWKQGFITEYLAESHCIDPPGEIPGEKGASRGDERS